MDSMEYDTYFTQAPQTYGYLSFGSEPNVLGHGQSNDNSGAVQSMETPFGTSNFMPTAFDYAFDTTIGASDSLPGVPNNSNSASPPSQQLLSNGSMDSGIALEIDNDTSPRHDRRSNSVEKDILTPAQSRRKAQNRAAQRAFRERKERHVRDLESKLTLLTTTTTSLQSDNERLKLLLQRTQTENEILKATASSSPRRHQPPSFVDDPSSLPGSRSTTAKSVSSASSSDGEPSLDRVRLANGLLSTQSSGTSPRSDSHLLSAGATWDLVQSHPLYARETLDIGEVFERLRSLARCDGTGPMFDEDDIRRVIEEVGAQGSDGLM